MAEKERREEREEERRCEREDPSESSLPAFRAFKLPRAEKYNWKVLTIKTDVAASENLLDAHLEREGEGMGVEAISNQLDFELPPPPSFFPTNDQHPFFQTFLSSTLQARPTLDRLRSSFSLRIRSLRPHLSTPSSLLSSRTRPSSRRFDMDVPSILKEITPLLLLQLEEHAEDAQILSKVRLVSLAVGKEEKTDPLIHLPVSTSCSSWQAFFLPSTPTLPLTFTLVGSVSPFPSLCSLPYPPPPLFPPPWQSAFASEHLPKYLDVAVKSLKARVPPGMFLSIIGAVCGLPAFARWVRDNAAGPDGKALLFLGEFGRLVRRDVPRGT